MAWVNDMFCTENLGEVLVVGLGKSGTDVVRYLAEQGSRITSLTIVTGRADRTISAEVARVIGSCIFPVVLWSNDEFLARMSADRGGQDQDVSQVFDAGIVSPGIACHDGLYVAGKAACAAWMSEPEFAYREFAHPEYWVGITGTNGKTTTTALATHVLNSGGIAARAVGNIGDTCIEALRQMRATYEQSSSAFVPDVLVAELSSYQLETTERFHPTCAVLLNITPDHLSWHQSFEAYAQAKYKLFAQQGANDLAICCTDDIEARAVYERLMAIDDRSAATIGLSLEAHSSAGILHLDGLPLVAKDELLLSGEHNMVNALAAALVGRHFGITRKQIGAALVSFAPLAHRIERVGECKISDDKTVVFINDSKATNPEAALKAVHAFANKNLILLLGGTDKHTEIDDFIAQCLASAIVVICYGEAGERFQQVINQQANERQERAQHESADQASTDQPTNQVGNPLPQLLMQTPHLQDAFEIALEIAAIYPCEEDESTFHLVLSPACASFDEFSSFEERGEFFKSLANEAIGAKLVSHDCVQESAVQEEKMRKESNE